LQPPARAGWPEGELRPLLAVFARRVGWRYALETIHLALTWGLAVAAVVLIFLHWTPLPAVAPAAAAGALVAALVSAGRWLLRPDALAVVRVADGLGLDGAAVTAYRLHRPKASQVKTAALSFARERVDLPAAWQQAALSRSLAACAGFMAGVAGRYPLIPSWTPWRGIAILLVVFAGLALTPSPLLPYWEARREERAALAAAAAAAERLVEPLAGLHRDGQPLLPEELQQRLANLERDIGSAGRREEAAANLRQAERDLEQAATELDLAGREAAQLASLWQEQAGAAWQQLAAALAGGDTAAAEQAARELWSELAGLPRGSQQAQEAALRFWQAAEAASQQELRQALRDAARALNNPGSQKDREQGDAARQGQDAAAAGNGDAGDDNKPGTGSNAPGNTATDSTNEQTTAGRSLANALADLAAASAARSQMLAAAAGLEQLGAGLENGSPAAMLAAAGTGMAAGGAGGAGGAAGSNSAGAAGGTGAAAGGSSAGTGTPGGGNPAGTGVAGGSAGAGGASGQPGQGYAAGDGQGSGNGSNYPAAGGNQGHGGQGAGAGMGGAGPGSGGSGNNAGSGAGGQGRGGGAGSGGGLESIYAPYLIGGEGAASQVHGSPRPGESGPEVSLPGAPVVRGAVRPYGEIYPAYTAQARETLSRSPLPSALENLVWQYFNSIDPGER
jgi:hypothetical protein